MALTPLDELVARLRRDPAATVLATDFDGTLAPIVDDPDTSRPLDGAGEVLAALAERYRTVAVLSGRPVSFLRPLVPAGVELHGLYGLERVVDGVVGEDDVAVAWRPVVEAAVAAARAWAPAGVLVEPKGLSLTLHYRTDPAAGAAVLAFAEARAAGSGLHVRPARMSVELHPPVAVDKGTVLARLGAGAVAACFLGDDAGDLPAFAALDGLAAAGTAVARIAVASPESPPDLLAAADAVVDGPAGVLAVLRALLD